MKSLKIIYISVTLMVVLALIAEFAKPKRFNWEPNFNIEDKNPFGMYVFKELIGDIFSNNKVEIYKKTLFEYKKEKASSDKKGIFSDEPKNFILIAKDIPLSESDVEDIKILLNQGNNIFISSSNFYELEKELGVESNFNNSKTFGNFFQGDNNTSFSFLNDSNNMEIKYSYPFGDSYYFSKDSLKYKIIVHAQYQEFQYYYPIIISIDKFGGKLILCSMPFVFTNVNLLDKKYGQFAEKTLSLLPDEPTIIMNYWSEDKSPLRYILADKSLKSAYYVLIYSVLFFMILGIKRRQRIIPVFRKHTNDTAEFISTIAKLSFASRNNKETAQKKISHFYHFINNTLNTNISLDDDDFYKHLSGKSGIPLKNIKDIFDKIDIVNSSAKIDDTTLKDFCNEIDEFYKKVKL